MTSMQRVTVARLVSKGWTVLERGFATNDVYLTNIGNRLVCVTSDGTVWKIGS